MCNFLILTYILWCTTDCCTYVTSVVLGTDMVARMSVHAMSALRAELLDCIGKFLGLSYPTQTILPWSLLNCLIWEFLRVISLSSQGFWILCLHRTVESYFYPYHFPTLTLATPGPFLILLHYPSIHLNLNLDPNLSAYVPWTCTFFLLRTYVQQGRRFTRSKFCMEYLRYCRGITSHTWSDHNMNIFILLLRDLSSHVTDILIQWSEINKWLTYRQHKSFGRKKGYLFCLTYLMPSPVHIHMSMPLFPLSS